MKISSDYFAAEGILEAICTSREKHTSKQQVAQAKLQPGLGLVGDAHAGTRREVSLLALEAINSMQGVLLLQPGDFAENLTTSGLQLEKLPLGSRLTIGRDAVLEVIQLGKKCHSKCEIYARLGDCVMPKLGIFARVLKPGTIKKGDRIQVLQAADSALQVSCK